MMLNLWLGYDIKQAVDARRLHHQVTMRLILYKSKAFFDIESIKFQIYPMTIQNENGFSESILKYLVEIGHSTDTYAGLGSAVTAIAVQDGLITANSDYRRKGVVAGF